MNGLERRLLAWAEERLRVDDLAATIEELAEEQRTTQGARGAARWRRREIRRAVLRALFSPEQRRADRNLPEVIARELRFALRRVARLPGHTLTFAGTVGTGIGIAVFMAEIRSDVLSPNDGVTADAPRVTWVTDEGAARPTLTLTGSEGWLQGDAGPFRALAAVWPSADVLDTPTGLLRVSGESVLPGHLGTLGARLRVGRDVAAPDEVVLSHRLWAERFESDESVVGRTVRLGERTVSIVGVSDPGFYGAVCCVPPSYWEVRPGADAAAPARVFVVDPTDDEAASAWLERMTSASDPPGRAVLRHPSAAPFGGERGFVGRVLGVLLGLAATVWATTLLSGANLVVADTLARTEELRLRTALGARSSETWIRVVCETAILAALSALAALVFAAAFATVAPWLLPIIGGSTSVRVAIGGGTLLLAAGAGAVSAFLAALPAGVVALRISSSSQVRRGPVSSRFATVGLGVQVALASTLVIVTGLFVSSLRDFDGAFVGFRNGETAVHFVYPASAELAPPVPVLLDAVGGNVALTARIPVYGAAWDSVSADGADRVVAAVESVTPGFFQVVGTTLTSGEAAGTPQEAVVSRDLADRLGWGDGAVGRTLLLADTVPLRVTGVVEAATWATGELRPTVYRGFSESLSNAVLLARGSSAASTVLLPALRPLAVALQPFETLDGLHVRSRVVEVFLARLALVFGGIALLVAIGAVHSHFLRWVRARERDMAIRRALGAPLPRLGRSLLVRALANVLPGALLGMVLGVVSARALASLLGPVPQLGVGLLGGTVGVLGAATLLALVGPIRRAGRIQPMAVLRGE